jgi:colanic acid biosynthesis glycosyl transferase WcaI
MSPLRVCFFNRSYHPDLAATGRLLTELAEGLVRDHGCEVSVVAGPALLRQGGDAAMGRGGLFFHREWRHGVEIVRARGTTFRPRRFAARFANYLSYFLSACVAGLRVGRPDVIVALTDPPIIGLAALLAARRARAGFVFLCQDVFPEVAALLEDFHSPAVNRLLDRINRLLIRRADRIVTVGETMRDRLVAEKGADPGKVAVIHNWADCSAIVPGPKRNAFSVSHGLADAFVVMHSGNVGLSQDLDTLLAAAHRLRHCPDVVVLVVGDGARRQALEARARADGLANVRFLPYQPAERVGESFAGADVFVVSLKRGLAGYIVPSKLYGILAAGRPYVAATEESSEVTAITEKYGGGLLARPGDPDDLAAKILALRADRRLGERLAANARRAALAFDRPNQVRAYRELFARVAGDAMRGTPLLKRPFDVALAAAGLVLSAPLWPLVAAAVKLGDGGPVFYAQERVGRGGRLFRSLKFRSMAPDSDARLGPRQAARGDTRVTRVGTLLRATALDELPQLLNILRGDMSFVGPRPLLPAEIELDGRDELLPLEAIPGYEARHRVRPGLTGVAQIYASRGLPRRQKFRLDLLYIRRQSLWLDLKLILLSFWITARGKWEHRGPKF